MNKTDRLELITLAEHHADQMYTPLQDKEIYHFIPDTPPPSVDSLKSHYARLAIGSSKSTEHWLNWVITKTDSNEIIGSLQTTVMVEDKVAYIAYILFPSFWGNGYASESVVWLIDYLKSMGNIETAIAEIDTRNENSIRVVKNLEFIRKDTLATDQGEDYIYEINIKSL